MNLAKLFELQKQLGQVGLFNYRGPDRFNKLVLALLVELGECANEWRGFKFWSKDQEPRTVVYQGLNDGINEPTLNPLLEEYVDGLHFVLELGIEFNIDNVKYGTLKASNVTDQFNNVFSQVSTLIYWTSEPRMITVKYKKMLFIYLGLGEMLGFTWGQIEEAYMGKNAINHKRQEQGY